MNKKYLVLSTGFALFSMFFGSGNLVFPITVGQESGGHFFLAALGIIFTGVFVPFLGVFGMMLYQGNLSSFFRSFGNRGLFLFSFLALSLMGPFGVLARCLTVAHGALLLLFPHVSLIWTSLSLCTLIFALTVYKSKIITVLGIVLTPFLLFAIGVIGFYGLHEGSFPLISTGDGLDALKTGFFQGYQTMDLLAAFFFSHFVISHLCKDLNATPDDQTTLKVFLQSTLIGAGILSAVYFILVLLGAIYSPLLANQPPQEMLGLIAIASLGKFAAPFVCLAVVFACLTTAIVLTSLFADFLKQEVSKGQLTDYASLLITLSIGFLVSTLDFAGIAKFLGPLLEIIYPALILHTIINVFCKICRWEPSHWPFTLAIVAKLCTI